MDHHQPEIDRCERQIREHLKEGDHVCALRVAYRGFAPCLFGFARRWGFSTAMCEDLLQSCFAALWKRGLQRRHAEAERLLPYLFGIMKNLCREARRTQVREAEAHQAAAVAAVESVPDQLLSDDDMRATFAALLGDARQHARDFCKRQGVEGEGARLVEVYFITHTGLNSAARAAGVSRNTLSSAGARSAITLRQKFRGQLEDWKPPADNDSEGTAEIDMKSVDGLANGNSGVLSSGATKEQHHGG